MTQQKRSFKNFLINKNVQGPVILLIIFVGFASSLVNATLYYLYVKGTFDIVFTSTNLPQNFIDNTYSDLLNFGLGLVIVSFLVTLGIAFYTLVITHRTAGACYRMKVVFEEIKDGKTNSRIFLRKNDELKDLAQSFNEMMDSLETNE